jgi:hypothetical protein
VGTPAGLTAAARQMAEWAAAETAWLDEHPPDPCYQAAADAYRTGVRSILTATAVFVAVAGGPSPPSEADAQAAGARLSDGRADLEAAAAQAKELRTACAS